MDFMNITPIIEENDKNDNQEISPQNDKEDVEEFCPPEEVK